MLQHLCCSLPCHSPGAQGGLLHETSLWHGHCRQPGSGDGAPQVSGYPLQHASMPPAVVARYRLTNSTSCSSASSLLCPLHTSLVASPGHVEPQPPMLVAVTCEVSVSGTTHSGPLASFLVPHWTSLTEQHVPLPQQPMPSSAPWQTLSCPRYEPSGKKSSRRR
jgi:hypothetical protein